MKIAIIANLRKDGIKTLIPYFIDLLVKEDIEAILDEELCQIFGNRYNNSPVDTLFNDINMIVSFGGDGTILHTAHISAGTGIPILGVNLGKVGFLAEISPEEIDTVPKRIKSGDYEILNRMAFSAETSCLQRYFALNDVVIDRNTDTRILNLTISVDGDYAGELSADGLIISTPTGSTAHSMAAGGPLVMPDCTVFVLTPICPHSLTIRPMIIEGSCEIRLRVANGSGRMAVDGQSFIDVPEGCEVILKRNNESVKVARFRDKTYFDILHTRLRWGVGLKMKNA
ncbi:MAG: NAD(+)/NADH kinase [Candidatus Latescibacteria bacterium]|nr:NAD(+)/NADH kinase [Candidatus Latescibacterota bacterium]